VENPEGDAVNLDHEAACRFTRLLHGGLGTGPDEKIAYLVRRHDGGPVRTMYSHPGELPAYLAEAAEVFISVCTFKGKRSAKNALMVPACWVDLDPPRSKDLERWRTETARKITGFGLMPSLIVGSGRGFHAYWLLDPAVSLEGPDRDRLAGLVVAVNRKLANLLAGDTVGDLARVMRLPGTVNPKNGALCRLVFEAGPMYELQDLAEDLGVTSGNVVPSAPPPRWSPVPPVKAARRRGRPRLGAKKRDLRTLPPWARDLVVGGAWHTGKRYRKAGGEPDRSRADMAAVGAMTQAGWSDERIFAAFGRTDWLIGARFRELWECEGQRRALMYLGRTIARARQGMGTAGSIKFTPPPGSRNGPAAA